MECSRVGQTCSRVVTFTSLFLPPLVFFLTYYFLSAAVSSFSHTLPLSWMYTEEDGSIPGMGCMTERLLPFPVFQTAPTQTGILFCSSCPALLGLEALHLQQTYHLPTDFWGPLDSLHHHYIRLSSQDSLKWPP